MTEILLKELSNTDIDWLVATGQQQKIAEGTVLMRSKEQPSAIYLLLEGVLILSVPRDAECDIDREIARFGRGEIVGISLLLDVNPIAAVVKAAEESIVLAISSAKLTAKLRQDHHFSTHFYRAIALILSKRLRHMLERSNQLRMAVNQPMKEALFMFSELQDSDVDWLVAAGQIQKIDANKVLVQAGRPTDAIHIVLDGLLSVAVMEGEMNPLTFCFECVEKNAVHQKIVGYLSKGEMSGSIAFLEAHPSPVTARAVDSSLILSIGRSQLTLKLQQDMGFATRFYRLLAIQLAEILQESIGLLGCPQQMYCQQKGMDETQEYDDELSLDSLHQVAQGAARFNWMLKRLGVI